MELKEQLEQLSTKLEGKTAKEIKSALEAFEQKNADEIANQVKEAKEALEAEMKKIQDHADALDVKLTEAKKKAEKAEVKDAIKAMISDNAEDIKAVRKGKEVQVKAVGDMTLGTNLTGDQPRDYNFDVVMFPSQKVNVSDLVGNVSISGGTYTFPRETASEGAIGTPGEGLTKSQIDYDLEMVDVNTDFIAGYSRYSKKMRNNLPFLESFLPRALRRDYMKQENSDFHAVIAAAATASTVVTGNKIERLIAEISALESLDHEANAIVVNCADWWDIQITEKSTGAGYGLPGVVTYDGGVLRINGIALVKANWIPANKYIVADWSRINKITTEGLSLEFSEVEGTNFVANNITARIESQVALAVEQPDAVIYGDFTAV